jgi:preprotein translocase subunit YajC
LLVIRPQQSKMKQHKQMLAKLAVGDKVVTTGGIIGVVCSTPDAKEELQLEVAKNVKITITKGAVAGLVPVEQQAA